VDALEARETRRPAIEKLTNTMMQGTLNKQNGRLTIGLDLGDRSSCYCVLDEVGDVLLEQKVPAAQ
jgi:transposase